MSDAGRGQPEGEPRPAADPTREADSDAGPHTPQAPRPATVSEPAVTESVADTVVDVEPQTGAPSDNALPVAPPSGPIRVRYHGRTDVGLVREHNEDNFLVADLTTGRRGVEPDGVVETEVGPRGVLLAVCDGMGGAAAGEVASQMAVDTIHEVISAGDPPADRDAFAHRLVAAIEEAGARIFAAAKMDRARRGMGTTATVAGLVDRVLFVGQVGDSRAYLLRGDRLAQITKDQSLVNQLIEAGQLTEEEAEAFEHSNIILQALGTTEEVSVDLTFLELRRGDRLMLCSDGLSGIVHTEVLRETLATIRDPVECARRLVEMANAGGGHDNITCVIADFDGDGLAPARPEEVALYQQYPLPPLESVQDAAPTRAVSARTTDVVKPGADVKLAANGDVDDVSAAASRPRSVLSALLLLTAVVATGFAIVLTMQPAPPKPPSESTPSRPVVNDEPVEVHVRSDVTGELYIDGSHAGALTTDADVVVPLPPGTYRFEARVGASTVATAVVTVRAGVPADVILEMPEGVDAFPAAIDAATGDAAATAWGVATAPDRGTPANPQDVTRTREEARERGPTETKRADGGVRRRRREDAGAVISDPVADNPFD
ncbi:MAG: protein phosphatase 2C domain-containing protein [Myxococcales bacterium]|nr:protein phosphatase 2C domain-containing protein [Myxococcales bacterium]